MGNSINKVTVLGRVGKEPEARAAGSSTVANFSVATESSFKDKSGEWQKETEWHNCVAWGKLADVIQKYVHKGDRIHIEGRLKSSSWEDKNTGQKRYKTEVYVNEICLLSDKKEKTCNTSEPEPTDYVNDDDIPF